MRNYPWTQADQTPELDAQANEASIAAAEARGRKIICFCGLPGAGKSYARARDPELRYAAHVDVADIYHDYPGIDYATAFGEVINQVLAAIDNGQTVAVEAVFARTSFQRKWIDMIGRMNGYKVEYREFFAEPDVLVSRIKAQFEEDLAKANGNTIEEARAKERAKARLEIAQNMTSEEPWADVN